MSRRLVERRGKIVYSLSSWSEGETKGCRAYMSIKIPQVLSINQHQPSQSALPSLHKGLDLLPRSFRRTSIFFLSASSLHIINHHDYHHFQRGHVQRQVRIARQEARDHRHRMLSASDSTARGDQRISFLDYREPNASGRSTDTQHF